MIDPQELKALEFIKEYGAKGVLQSELWKFLGATSRLGSRIAVKLEEDGLIRREKELNKGRWTYRLYYTKKEPEKIEWDTLDNCPCFLCSNLEICGIDKIITCKDLLAWMEESVSKKG
ncbi:MAG: helix-turn-helix transcriptional regulator [Candidatus Helarchaeota archaeon]